MAKKKKPPQLSRRQSRRQKIYRAVFVGFAVIIVLSFVLSTVRLG